MKSPWEWEEQDVEQLICDQVTESLTLEFKACDALKRSEESKKELSKDVSAFANSAGGTIIYGVLEDRQTHEAKAIDIGYDPTQLSSEWLEQVINSKIQRRIEGLRIKTVTLNKSNPGMVLYVVSIPESNRAPHMAADHRFYKRFEFQSVAMEEYEVRERYRRETYPSRDIACAWRDAVINPLIMQVTNVEQILGRETWTWNRYYKTFNQLTPLSVRSLESGNREQFVQAYPYVTTALQLHDDTLENLNATCSSFFEELRNSSWFQERYAAASTSESLRTLREEFPSSINRETPREILTELFGSNSKIEDHCAILAECTINRVGALAVQDRSYGSFWNKHRDSFLQLTTPQSPLAGSWKRVTDLREQLMDATAELKSLLKRIRSELSQQHGIPIEPIIQPSAMMRGGFF